MILKVKTLSKITKKILTPEVYEQLLAKDLTLEDDLDFFVLFYWINLYYYLVYSWNSEKAN